MGKKLDPKTYLSLRLWKGEERRKGWPFPHPPSSGYGLLQLNGLKWDCFPEHLWGHPSVNSSYSLTKEQRETGKAFVGRLLSELAESIPLPSLFPLWKLPLAAQSINSETGTLWPMLTCLMCCCWASEICVFELFVCTKIKGSWSLRSMKVFWFCFFEDSLALFPIPHSLSPCCSALSPLSFLLPLSFPSTSSWS